MKSLSRVRLFATPWTAAYQAPPSMGFSRQEYWSGVPLPSPMSLLSLSWIFSILVSRLFIYDSILFSRFWIISTIIFRNSLSGRFSVSSSFVWFGGHLSCSFTCWVFLCLFILFILLCLGWPFCILAVCGVLFLVEFPHCGWGCIGDFIKASWLGKLVSMFWWVGLDFFSLECNEVSSNEL